jgi:translation elongation factor EF-1beta
MDWEIEDLKLALISFEPLPYGLRTMHTQVVQNEEALQLDNAVLLSHIHPVSTVHK